jgi:MerR family transcriptional regulator, mercuric resistance operon regulatory protein
MYMVHSGLMRIGAVAAAANVNGQTLRFYERAGLLDRPRRSPNGYRDYPEDTVALVRFIKRAQDLGFSLQEAGSLSALRAAPGRRCRDARQLAASKLTDIDRRIADLSAIRAILRSLIRSCDDSGRLPACPILSALDATATDFTSRRRPAGGASGRRS